jgi:hypothetical protein
MSDLEMEAFESLDEAFDEYDESDEFAEARSARARARGRTAPLTRPKTATGQGLFNPQRPNTNYVTQTQLQAALARVSEQIKTNSTAITTVNARLTTISAEQDRQAAALRAEIANRRKEAETVKKDLRQTRELAALLPLLSRPSSVEIKGGPETGLAANTRVLVDKNDSLSMMLPMLLMGGLGGNSADGSSDNNMMMFLALAMAGSK